MLLQTQDLQIGKTVYRVREAGDNEKRMAVLFLHGLSWSGQAFVPMMREMEGKRCIAPDLLWHPWPSKMASQSFDKLSEELHALLMAMQIDRVDVVAHSWGASLGVYFAAHFPKCVQSLTLLDGGFMAIGQLRGLFIGDSASVLAKRGCLDSISTFINWAKQDALRWNREIEASVRDLVELEEDGHVTLKINTEIKRSAMKNLLNFQPLQYADRLNMPVLLIVADHPTDADTLNTFKNEQLDAFQKAAACQVKKIDGVSHQLILEIPEQCAAEIHSFLTNKTYSSSEKND